MASAVTEDYGFFADPYESVRGTKHDPDLEHNGSRLSGRDYTHPATTSRAPSRTGGG
ncbi:MAG TPA: hypothetical protein VLA88_00835 [Candidatus Saccharimonadales bacterium]|nr:hypothetical protein [Candidatus Saccharimonadales bacterium]